MGITELVITAAAVAWTSHALVHKDGPYELLQKFRIFVGTRLQSNSPLGCVFCTSFWVGLSVIYLLSLDIELFRLAVQFFGVLGLSALFSGGYSQ